MDPTLDGLLDAIASFVVDGGDSAVISLAAADALAAGIDTPHLRELAGEPTSAVESEIHGLLADTMAELGLVMPRVHDGEALHRVFRLQCERHFTGEVATEELGRWVLARFDRHELPDGPVRRIATLRDDLYDLDLLAGDWVGPTRQEILAETTDAAKAFLASYPRE